jgi:isopenicillin-N N-acyltransferase-like protein
MGSRASGDVSPRAHESGVRARAARLAAFVRRHPKKLAALALFLAFPFVLHLVVGLTTRIHPPALPEATLPLAPHEPRPGLRRLGAGWARKRGDVLEVHLAGSPEQIGHQHGRLLYPEMLANEGVLYEQFERHVPFFALRWMLVDLSRVRYRHVDLGVAPERRLEIAAQARAFSPDPFSSFLPTYHRFVFLQALYDIMLSFEHSPLLGCTSFALGDGAFEGGHAVLARNFDFEAGPIFDRGKAVFLVREDGRIPYASVAWPGLVGVVSGMNAEGVAVVLHGGRAREPRAQGEPVVHTLRDVLGQARNTDEALRLFSERERSGRGPMVSHIVMLTDASGDAAVVERAPGEPSHVRRGRGKVALTNHFEGPFEADARNQRVREKTSTLARRRRLDERLENLPRGVDVQGVVDVLRDKRGPGGGELPLGSRRAIDALIATHAVIMDSTDRRLWVSEGPHLVSRFLRFDLARLLAASYDPEAEPDPDPDDGALPADPIRASGAYDEWVKAGQPHARETP